MAICDGSRPEILRVRLLSSPQQRQAAVISSPPWESANPPSCGSESKTLPRTMSAKPAPTRLSTFSWYTIHAIAAVATASRLSKRDAVLADVVMSPSSSSAGPSIPPARMAPPSQENRQKRGFCLLTRTDHSYDGKAGARAEVKQTRNEQRIGGRNSEFCQRSARAEKQCCAKRDEDAGVSAHEFLQINDHIALRLCRGRWGEKRSRSSLLHRT